MRTSIALFLGVIIALGKVESAITFEALGDALISDSSTGSTTLVDTGLSASLVGYTGDALVISTYSAEKSSNSNPLIATHQNFLGSTSIGQGHIRSIQKSSKAAGAGSAIGIASLSGGGILTLRHAKDNSSPNLVTKAVSTLSVIPLSSGATTLSHASTSSGTQVSTTASSFSGVATTSSFNVAAIHPDTSEIFIMASFDVSADQDGLGTWQLQYRNISTTGNWVNTGNQGQRSINTASGVVTLIALADVDAVGNYEVQLVQASDGSANLTTERVDLLGLSLSIDANSYLPSYEASSIGVDGATISLSIAGDMSVFAAANITADSTQDDTGTYTLSADDGTGSSIVSTSIREVDSRDLGSIALSGIIDMQAVDSNSLVISDSSSKLGFSPDSNFVVFGLTAVPEPSSAAMVLGMCSLMALLFRKKNNCSRI